MLPAIPSSRRRRGGAGRWIVAVAVAFAPGCGHDSPPPKPFQPLTAKTVRPLGGTEGRVERVNAKLRLVVLDYSLNALPAIGSRLQVIREGAPVGELRITGPSQGTKICAELVSGDADKGDETSAPAQPPADATRQP